MRNWLIAVSLTFSLTGCGGGNLPTVVPVSGKVMYQEKPVANAQVAFHNDNAPRAATATTDEQGFFQLSTFGHEDGAVPGTHRVTVFKPKNAAGTDALEGAAYEEAMEALITGDPADQSQLPAAYADPGTSGLVVEIGPNGADEITLELTDPS